MIEGIFQTFLYGIQTGTTYVLVALGFTIIFSILGIINLAHGELYMIGAFCLYFLVTLFNLNYFIALLITIILVGFFGILLERIFFRPLRNDSDMVVIIIIITGLMLIIQGLSQIIFGPESRGMQEIIDGNIKILNTNFSIFRTITATISICLVAGLCFFVYKTKTGIAMLAVSQNKTAAILQGVNVNKIYAIGFCLSAMLAAAAGGLMAPVFLIDTSMGGSILFKALSIVILGGIGSIPGAVLGGFILGIIESFGLRYLGYASATFPFLLIIFILLFKRTGLLGKAE